MMLSRLAVLLAREAFCQDTEALNSLSSRVNRPGNRKCSGSKQAKQVGSAYLRTVEHTT